MAKTLTLNKVLTKADNTGIKKFSTLKEAFKHIEKNLAEIHLDTHAKLLRGRGR